VSSVEHVANSLCLPVTVQPFIGELKLPGDDQVTITLSILHVVVCADRLCAVSMPNYFVTIIISYLHIELVWPIWLAVVTTTSFTRVVDASGI